MKKLFILISIIILAGCKKDNKPDPNAPAPADVQKADNFKTSVSSDNFYQLFEYYSPNPIDYYDTDNVVRAETDLWIYVSPWLKDDKIDFKPDNKVDIIQGPVKIDGQPAEIIQHDYKIGADKDGVYMNFLGHMYQPLKYRLVEFNDTSFVVYAEWRPGVLVYSKFRARP
jgi:hypothetical protein